MSVCLSHPIYIYGGRYAKEYFECLASRFWYIDLCGHFLVEKFKCDSIKFGHYISYMSNNLSNNLSQKLQIYSALVRLRL